jgi:hypothetical protein
MALEGASMELNPQESRPVFVHVPPSYEQCAAAPVGSRAEFVASPLAMAALFGWDDEVDD